MKNKIEKLNYLIDELKDRPDLNKQVICYKKAIELASKYPDKRIYDYFKTRQKEAAKHFDYDTVSACKQVIRLYK